MARSFPGGIRKTRLVRGQFNNSKSAYAKAPDNFEIYDRSPHCRFVGIRIERALRYPTSGIIGWARWEPGIWFSLWAIADVSLADTLPWLRNVQFPNLSRSDCGIPPINIRHLDEREEFELAISPTRNFAALLTSVLRATSTEVRRKMRSENDFGARCSPTSTDFRPKNVQMPAVNCNAAGRGEVSCRREWRRERNWDPTFSRLRSVFERRTTGGNRLGSRCPLHPRKPTSGL